MTTYMKLVKGATKVKMAPPKQKYIDPILLGTASRQDFQEIVRALAPRIADPAFTVSFKALIVMHLMMREGERDVALEYYADNLHVFDRCGGNGSGNGGGDAAILHHYAQYLRCRCGEFSMTRVDYVRDGYASLRSIITDGRSASLATALDHVGSLETQVAQLLHNTMRSSDLDSDMILFAFKLLVFDLLALYNALNEGIITLLESFFELSHADAQRTLDLYKRFVSLTESVVRYLKTGKAVGLKIPVIKHITTKLVRSLEEHLREDDVTHNTFNDGAAQQTSAGATGATGATGTGASGLAQKRLDEVREQKRKLQEQLAHPQLLINATGGGQQNNNPFGMAQGPLPQLPGQVQAAATMPLPQQQAPQMFNNPFMAATGQQQAQQQVPQAQMPQAQMPAQIPQQMQQAQMQQPQMPQQAPQPQQMPQMQPAMTMPAMMQTPPSLTSMPTSGTNNPFSISNAAAVQQVQEQNNPFAKTNYQDSVSTASTSIFSPQQMPQQQQQPQQPQQVNNPFSLQHGQPQAQSPQQPHTLQSAMTMPTQSQMAPIQQQQQQQMPQQQIAQQQYNQQMPQQQYNQQMPQQQYNQQMPQQQQQQYGQQMPQQQEINLIDF